MSVRAAYYETKVIEINDLSPYSDQGSFADLNFRLTLLEARNLYYTLRNALQEAEVELE